MTKFSKEDLSRIIEMAWEDRTPFEAIKNEFGLDQSQVKKNYETRIKRRFIFGLEKKGKRQKNKTYLFERF